MALTEHAPLRIAEIPTDVDVDPVTLDIIEGALKNARFEMDAVLFRSAMSPVIREQHDEFPMLTDPRGRMVVGQFGAYINEMMEDWDRGVYPGDVILTSDPFKCSASISHTNDWLVLLPIFFEDELVGWSSQFGHQMDAGGPLAGSLPTGARTIFEEGIIIPPIKIIERGEVQEDVLRLIFNNVRLPEMNRADLFAIVAGCRAGERRVLDLCERFGKQTYLAALQALLDRTYEAMRTLLQVVVPEEPQSFEDYVDDDGLGNGPFKMKLTIWREGEHAFFDWTGTDPQALGPINFYLSEGMFKMFIGIYLIMVNDPQILFNDGFYPLLHVVLPEGCLLKPRFPAALGCRTHGLARLFDVLGGALCKQAPELNTAAGYGTSPYMLYSGWDGNGDFFYSMEILYGGIPGRPIGDGMDGHSWWPLFENIPTEYLEAYYPLRIDGYTTVQDSGGAGLHRGGNGVEKRYVYLEPGEVSIHDDRWLTRPWGVLGGEPGERSEKLL
ncbi:MAG TPA: hydantoinase B/oxoprolinase family protein, partial [Gaiellaceae bacterium]